MIQSNRRYTNRFLAFLMSWNVQFFLGFFLSVIFIGLMVWGGEWQSWFDTITRFNSLFAVIVIYVLSFISLRQFLNYLGFLNLRYVIPVIFVWFGLSLSTLFVFRLSYSVYFLVLSLVSMLLFFWSVCYIRNRYARFSAAYIGLGGMSEGTLPKPKTIDWVMLEKPVPIASVNADVVIADLRADLGNEWEQFLAACTLKHIPVYHSSRFIEAVSGRVKIDHLYENDLGSLLPSRSYLLIKRFLDIVLVLISLPVVLPIMLVTAFLIKSESPGGALFIQERIGEGGVPYKMYKFRSMYVNKENQQTQKNDSRITKVGQIIRKTRIDELPQFFNVLKGEMSLIGPRSEIPSFVNSYKRDIPFYDYRHIVKPGISGWAQVMHGYTADTEETRIKLEHDFYYVKNFSFSMDLLILFKTIQTILTGFGAR